MRELLKLVDALNREFMKLIDRNYINKKLAKRKGKCLKCGKCCKGCKFLDKKTKLCKVYNSRPSLICHKDFPLDKREQWIWNVKKCGYSFKKKIKLDNVL
ncbi:MAG: YkgJ family cysteine cluster protein [Candidatus Nanoarchaeia archaeon]|nr:YkgJ family cysteine cluster protein [Candidatus Nanoarchaeia archaeon]MDD5740753.1 YkgJ family cysteine cluster protein [Candidatus Nanoarchaeia archaeon]